ncbi:hypothetical protein D1007_06486 [Hordeum vulgare]|nr:hypothetical protein D1007_06486 [Hordeum vulgare]
MGGPEGRKGKPGKPHTLRSQLDPVYAANSPNWEVWFAVEHEEQHGCGMHEVQPEGPSSPPLVIDDEDQEAEAAYQATLTAILHDTKEEARRRADEEAAYQQQLAEAIALPTIDD